MELAEEVPLAVRVPECRHRSSFIAAITFIHPSAITMAHLRYTLASVVLLVLIDVSMGLVSPWLVAGERRSTMHHASTTRVMDQQQQDSSPPKVDNRPFVQRVKGPRPARRLNHAFRYLYRHDLPSNITSDPMQFLIEQGFSRDEVLEMNRTFPPLLTLSVQRHLYPKMRFLNETLQIDDISAIPPPYFGARLERTIAPRHAFLVYKSLPHGKQLFVKDHHRWRDFLLACRKTKHFAALCQTWKRQAGSTTSTMISPKEIEAFDVLFSRGIMACARNELTQPNSPWNNTWPLDYINITSAQLLELLISHGANPMERDHRGVSLLHWAAGSGNVEALQVLLPYFEEGVWTKTERDGATPLHWAVAGANAREFGTGGHVEVCHYLLSQVPSKRMKDYVNQPTLDGNTALMWAAWSGTLDTVKLLVRHRASTQVSNRNGCTVAHWAASGGNVDVCRYLKEVANVDFAAANYGGNTPLTHAVAFGRKDVIEWLREVLVDDAHDTVAFNLAKDFVHWTDGDERRNQVLQLFQDWYAYDEDFGGASDDEAEDDEVDAFF